jgi:hypothetical protein
MKAQIENLKQELREFIELLKTITQGKWECADDGDIVYRQPKQMEQAAGIIIHGRNSGITRKQDERDATFIARSRNISPSMAECLLRTIEYIENDAEIFAENCQRGYASRSQLQQILTIWEAAK